MEFNPSLTNVVGQLYFVGTGTGADNTKNYINNDGANNTQINVPTGKVLVMLVNGTSSMWVGASAVTKLFNIATAGLGIPAIYATTVQNPVNAAPTTLSYTPPATAGYYRASWYLDITTATAITFIAKLTYTDPAGTARSANIMFVNEGGTAVLAGGPAANTAGQWFGSQTFAIDNSAAAITVANNAGTYTTCNYRWQVAIEQLI